VKLVFAAFLCACAWEDFKEKKISVLLLWAAGSVAAAWMAGYYMILLDWTDMNEAYLWLIMRGTALIPGAVLLALSGITKGAIGKGDGLFFLVSGMYLGFWDNIALLFCGLLLCSFWGMGMFIWGMFGKKKIKNIRLPFLPFLIPAAVILTAIQRGTIL
jgi:leader peptidase (prepilin peptidase)/N-methyltransferase